MLGRSDGTLNPNGVRFGSSEIYNIGKIFNTFIYTYFLESEYILLKFFF